MYNKVQDWNNVDIEEVSNQEKVVREYFKRLEWEDSDIDEQIENLKDTSKLELPFTLNIFPFKYKSKIIIDKRGNIKEYKKKTLH